MMLLRIYRVLVVVWVGVVEWGNVGEVIYYCFMLCSASNIGLYIFMLVSFICILSLLAL
jgi:hypothetical protein